MMDALALFDALRGGVGGLLVAIGFGFVGGGTVGLLRFPDLYTRIHASSAGDAVGSAIVVLGLAIVSADLALAGRLALLALLLAIIGPVFSQFVANAAHAGGLAPLSGRYTAPRRGRGDSR